MGKIQRLYHCLEHDFKNYYNDCYTLTFALENGLSIKSTYNTIFFNPETRLKKEYILFSNLENEMKIYSVEDFYISETPVFISIDIIVNQKQTIKLTMLKRKVA